MSPFLSWTNLRTVRLHHVAEHEEGDVEEQGPHGRRLGWRGGVSELASHLNQQYVTEERHSHTVEHATLAFELTSFAADVFRKLVEPRTEREKQNTK